MRVQVKMAPGNQYASAFVEVMGRVGEDGSLEEVQSYDLGDNFGARLFVCFGGNEGGFIRGVDDRGCCALASVRLSVCLASVVPVTCHLRRPLFPPPQTQTWATTSRCSRWRGAPTGTSSRSRPEL